MGSSLCPCCCCSSSKASALTDVSPRLYGGRAVFHRASNGDITSAAQRGPPVALVHCRSARCQQTLRAWTTRQLCPQGARRRLRVPRPPLDGRQPVPPSRPTTSRLVVRQLRAICISSAPQWVESAAVLGLAGLAPPMMPSDDVTTRRGTRQAPDRRHPASDSALRSVWPPYLGLGGSSASERVV